MLVTEALFWIMYLFVTAYTVFLLTAYLNPEEEREEKKAIPEDELPSITIAIPAWNEEETISETVRSVLRLDYPQEKLRVIVVDDGSADRTALRAKEAAGDDPRVTILRQENRGKAAALNTALEHTKTDLFACLDADSYVTPQALKRMVHHFADPRVAAVAPYMHVARPRTLLQKLQQVEYAILGIYREAMSRLNIINVLPGPFSVYRTRALREAGGFSMETIVEDQEIAWRLLSHGWKLRFEKEAIVYTHTPATLRGLYKQRKRWYLGSLITVYAYKHLAFKREHGHLGLFLTPAMFFALSILPFLAAFILAGTLIPQLVKKAVTVYLTGIVIDPSFSLTDLVYDLYLVDGGMLFASSMLFLITGWWIIHAYRTVKRVMPGEKPIRLGTLIPYLAAYFIIILTFKLVSLKSLPRLARERVWWK